jgi:phospholipid/cholesterol/gamma-HCH transport system substrate-binding protein
MKRLLAILLVVGVAASGCSLVGGGGGTYEMTAVFPRAVALYEQSDVRVLGLPAGTVTDIEVVDDYVKVTLEIQDDVPVPADVQAAIVPRSLIGERFIQLMPAWQEGQPRAKDGDEIPIDRTIIPIEPDEALAALKKFLDALDPKGLGRLVSNLAEDLDGNGETLGSALGELSDVVSTLDNKKETLLSIVDNFDAFTQTLVTREEQLGQVLEAFGQVSQILADERADLERLLEGLAAVSQDGLDLVSEHAARLETDIATLTRLGRSIDANLSGVKALLDSNAPIIDGFIGAYNEDLRAINVRQNFGPVAAEALNPLFDALGVDLPSVCVQVAAACVSSVSGQSAGEPTVADLHAPVSPVLDLLHLLGARTVPSTVESRPSGFEAVVNTLLGVTG